MAEADLTAGANPAANPGAHPEAKPRRRHQFSNFDAIRIIGSIAVVYSHSYMVAEGHEDNELFQMWFGETFGMFFVYMFFVMSGFLITKSWFGSKGVRDYAWKRFLRIYPAYFASVMFVALVLGPLGYQLWKWRPYFTDPDVLITVARALVFKLDREMLILPSVVLYQDDRYMGWILNAVIWTIQVEIFMYAVVALLGVTRLLRPSVMLVLALVGFWAHLTDAYIYIDLRETLGIVDSPWSDFAVMNWWSVSWAAPGFFAGAFLYFICQKHEPSTRIAAAFGALCVITLFMDWSWLLPEDGSSMRFFSLLCAYPVVWLGHSKAPSLGNWTRFGDLSYGLYIFSWPIQQLVRSYVGDGLTGWQFFPLCLVPNLLVAYASWHLIEKHALAFKPGAKGAGGPDAAQPPRQRRWLFRAARRI